jgi:hypothetical protein
MKVTLSIAFVFISPIFALIGYGLTLSPDHVGAGAVLLGFAGLLFGLGLLIEFFSLGHRLDQIRDTLGQIAKILAPPPQ